MGTGSHAVCTHSHADSQLEVEDTKTLPAESTHTAGSAAHLVWWQVKVAQRGQAFQAVHLEVCTQWKYASNHVPLW